MIFRSAYLLCLVTIFGIAGCSNTTSEAPSARGNDASAAPIEVAAFQGGYGIDFFEQAAKELSDKTGAKVTVEGSPRIWEQLRPRFIAGNPPDVTWPGWNMDYWALIYDGQLLALDEALDGPAYEGTGTWRESFEPSLLKLGMHEGKTYMMPYHYNVMGWWYDPKVFAANGWAPPKTYEELLTLGEQIKAKGIAPLTFQGQYPYYMLYGFLFPWVISAGGMQAMDNMQNLEPGAWNAPAVIKAASMIAELRDKGFFQKGAMGLSHTESQTEFLQGRAAMIPCGTWLYAEMKETMPPSAAIEFMRVPMLAKGVGDPTALQIGIEPWVVPIKAKNAPGGIEYLKYITSLPKAKQFVEEKGTLMGIRGTDEAEVPAHLREAAKAFQESKAVFSAEYRMWYPAFGKEVENAMAALLNGQITPAQFGERCEREAEKVRNDSSIKKHRYQSS